MAQAQAFFDGYDGLEIELSNGLTLKAKALPLARAAHYLRLWEQHRGKDGTPGDAAATDKILTEFPLEPGLEDVRDKCRTLAEFWEAFECFFAQRTERTAARPAAALSVSLSPGTTS